MFSDNGGHSPGQVDTSEDEGDNEPRVKLGCLGREPGSRLREKRGRKEIENRERKNYREGRDRDRKEEEAKGGIMESWESKKKEKDGGNATDKI